MPHDRQLVERIAKIIAPALWGAPMAYPEEIESAEDLAEARGGACRTAIRILDALRTDGQTARPDGGNDGR